MLKKAKVEAVTGSLVAKNIYVYKMWYDYVTETTWQVKQVKQASKASKAKHTHKNICIFQ